MGWCVSSDDDSDLYETELTSRNVIEHQEHEAHDAGGTAMTTNNLKPGDLVERISTGWILPFVMEAGSRIHVLASEDSNSKTIAAWPAEDCRPVEDNISRCDKCGHEFDTNDTRMEQEGDYSNAGRTFCPACALEIAHTYELREKANLALHLERCLAAEREKNAELRKLCGVMSGMVSCIGKLKDDYNSPAYCCGCYNYFRADYFNTCTKTAKSTFEALRAAAEGWE